MNFQEELCKCNILASLNLLDFVTKTYYSFSLHLPKNVQMFASTAKLEVVQKTSLTQCCDEYFRLLKKWASILFLGLVPEQISTD